MADQSPEDFLAPHFSALSLSPKALAEALRNKKIASTWTDVITHELPAPVTNTDPKIAAALGNLVSATKDTGNLGGNRAYIVKAILDGRIKTNIQVDAAIKHIKALDGKKVDDAAFEKECGVGVEYTPERVKEDIAKYIAENKKRIEEERYKGVTATLLALKAETPLKWAPPGDVKKELDAQYLALLGPKDERDAAPSKKAAKPAKGAAAKGPVVKQEEVKKDRMFVEGFLAALHKPGENPQKNPKRMEEHIKATGKRVFTRFPPEPNGYLHIGHSKAIAVNFGFARYHGGECYLRYDDTNPESEEEVYMIAIREIIEWLGFKPFAITHASDHFDRLYELAEDLIKRGKGYICHCTAEEVREQRGGKEGKTPRFECKHRNRPLEENLAEFRAMRDGKYKPKEAMLRMKQDILGSGNPQVCRFPQTREGCY